MRQLDDLANWLVFTVDYRAIRDAAFLARDARVSFWGALLIAAARRQRNTAHWAQRCC